MPDRWQRHYRNKRRAAEGRGGPSCLPTVSFKGSPPALLLLKHCGSIRNDVREEQRRHLRILAVHLFGHQEASEYFRSYFKTYIGVCGQCRFGGIVAVGEGRGRYWSAWLQTCNRYSHRRLLFLNFAQRCPISSFYNTLIISSEQYN